MTMMKRMLKKRPSSKTYLSGNLTLIVITPPAKEWTVHVNGSAFVFILSFAHSSFSTLNELYCTDHCVCFIVTMCVCVSVCVCMCMSMRACMNMDVCLHSIPVFILSGLAAQESRDLCCGDQASSDQREFTLATGTETLRRERMGSSAYQSPRVMMWVYVWRTELGDLSIGVF